MTSRRPEDHETDGPEQAAEAMSVAEGDTPVTRFVDLRKRGGVPQTATDAGSAREGQSESGPAGLPAGIVGSDEAPGGAVPPSGSSARSVPGSTGGPNGRRVTPAMAGIVTTGVVIAVVALASFLFRSTPVAGGAGGTVTGAGQPAASTDSVPGSAGGPAAFTCWNGTGAVDPDSCTVPAGEVGLSYFFPSFQDLDKCRPVKSVPSAIRYDCDLGSRGLLRFRWWQDTDRAETHYTRKFRDGVLEPLKVQGEVVGLLGHDVKPVRGVYRMSGFMFDHFSFTVEASSLARQMALLKEVLVRPPSELRGHPGSATSAGVPIDR